MAVTYPHRIRLHGPWRAFPSLNATTSVPATIPYLSSLPGEDGETVLVRGFGYPGQIDAYERVWLDPGRVEGKAEVWLNGHHLGEVWEGAESPEFDVTALLAPRNELRMVLTPLEGRFGLLGDVGLVIRCLAYLRELRIDSNAVGLAVAGSVVGQSDAPLDLYCLFNDRTVAYQTVKPTAEGQPFLLAANPDDGPLPARAPDSKRDHVRVELVHGAVVWYRWDAWHDLPRESPARSS